MCLVRCVALRYVDSRRWSVSDSVLVGRVDIAVSSSSVVVSGNSVTRGGIFVTSSGSGSVAPTVQNNAVSNTTELAVGVFSDRLDPALLTGNTATNAGNGLGLSGVLVADLVVPGSLGLPLVLTGELKVAAGVSMTVGAGSVVKAVAGDSWSGFPARAASAG